MSWLARLKAENSGQCTPCDELPKLSKGAFGSKDSAPHCAHGENSQGAAAPAWLLHFPDADPLEVHFIPAATRAEALAAYPDAVAATPLPKLAEEPERSCRGCRHFRRPGLSGGYCGGDLPDLSPAYGPGHSLRRLPIDGGASCLGWEVPNNA